MSVDTGLRGPVQSVNDQGINAESRWRLDRIVAELRTSRDDGRFGKQDFVYLPEEDAYRCPAREQLLYRFTSEEDGKRLRRYWTTACQDCSLKSQCTTRPERRIPRWEHEHLLEAVQQRLDANPQAMRQRRETVEHLFGTMKAHRLPWQGRSYTAKTRNGLGLKIVPRLLGCRPSTAN